MLIHVLNSEQLLTIYHNLLDQIGPRNWWPADSPFEVIIGAILTQNTAWKNVEKAIENLKKNNLLSPKSLFAVPINSLAELIRSSGYYNQKAKKIKNFLDYFIHTYSGSIDLIKQQKTEILREELLAINGIGPETADAILLYALQKPIFVVDSYTRRIFSRHNWFYEDISYQEMQDFFMDKLEKNVALFNEFHALIDYIGHYFCKKNPNCVSCPLVDRLPCNSKDSVKLAYSFEYSNSNENK